MAKGTATGTAGGRSIPETAAATAMVHRAARSAGEVPFVRYIAIPVVSYVYTCPFLFWFHYLKRKPRREV